MAEIIGFLDVNYRFGILTLHGIIFAVYFSFFTVVIGILFLLPTSFRLSLFGD